MFTLKNVKYLAGMSQETHCYTASLYFGGTKVADVGNNGHGGPDDLHITCSFAQWDQVKEHIDGLNTSGEAGNKTDLEGICCDLVNDWLAAKDLKRLLSRRVLWTKPGKPGIYQTQCAKNAAIKKAWIDQIAGDVVDIVLNNEPFEDALRIFKERT